MKAITTIFLINKLRATLEHVERIPDMDPNYPGLVEFQRTLITKIHELQIDDRGPDPGENIGSA